MYVPFLLLPILYSCGSQTLPCNKSLRELVKHRYLDPIPKVSDSGGVGWGLRICIVANPLGDADAVPVRTSLSSTALRCAAFSLWLAGGQGFLSAEEEIPLFSAQPSSPHVPAWSRAAQSAVGAPRATRLEGQLSLIGLQPCWLLQGCGQTPVPSRSPGPSLPFPGWQ